MEQIELLCSAQPRDANEKSKIKTKIGCSCI